MVLFLHRYLFNKFRIQRTRSLLVTCFQNVAKRRVAHFHDQSGSAILSIGHSPEAHDIRVNQCAAKYIRFVCEIVIDK